MKVHIEIDMTPEEARKMMGLPDVTALQAKFMDETEARMRAAMDASDPEAMMKAWMPMAGPAFEQFQRFLWDSAKMATSGGGESKKPAGSKSSR